MCAFSFQRLPRRVAKQMTENGPFATFKSPRRGKGGRVKGFRRALNRTSGNRELVGEPRIVSAHDRAPDISKLDLDALREVASSPDVLNHVYGREESVTTATSLRSSSSSSPRALNDESPRIDSLGQLLDGSLLFDEIEQTSSTDHETLLCVSCSSPRPFHDKGKFCGNCGRSFTTSATEHTTLSHEKEVHRDSSSRAFATSLEAGEEITKSRDENGDEGEDEAEDKECTTSTGYVKGNVNLYFAGVPNVIWYCHANDTFQCGIKGSEKYMAYLQIIKAYVAPKRKTPWPLMVSWYGVTNAQAIRDCSINRVNGRITLDITKEVPYYAEKSPRMSKSEEKDAMQIPMRTPAYFIAREGGVRMEQASFVGRAMSIGVSQKYATEKDWKGVFGVAEIPTACGEPRYYTIDARCVDEVNDLNPLHEIVWTVE